MPVKVFSSSHKLTANVLSLVYCVAVLNIFVPSREIWRFKSGETEDYEAV
jgi:hypothetical protein